jgi:uncharacterized protein (TIGR02271 family)
MTARSREALPSERAPERSRGGWSIRLPVRAEEVSIGKQTVVRERVVLKRKRIEDVARVTAVVRHEELRTNSTLDSSTR